MIDFHVQNPLMHFNEANCRLVFCGLKSLGSCWSVLDCDVIIHKCGGVLSGFLNTRKLVKARDRRRSAFVLFFVVFLLNWFLKRVYFIISKIKTTTEKTSCTYLFFAFYFCIVTYAYLPVSVMKCVFVLF